MTFECHTSGPVAHPDNLSAVSCWKPRAQLTEPLRQLARIDVQHHARRNVDIACAAMCERWRHPSHKPMLRRLPRT